MRSVLAAVAAGLLGGWSPLAAQSSPPTPTFHSRLVVTASLEPRLEEEVAASVDVVDAEAIESRQAELVLDLLRELPGLAVVQSGSPGKVASLFTRGTSSAHTRVLLDGVTLNDPVLGAFDWSGLETEGLDRIEVARGPFSALWGSSAVGGVVQLVTRTGGAARGSIRVEGGSNEYGRGGFDLSVPRGPVSMAVAGHLRRGEGELDNDSFDAEGARLRLDLSASAGFRIGLEARAADAEIGLPFDFASTPTPNRRQASDSRLVALPLDAVLGAWQLELRLARTESDLEIEDADDPFAASRSETRRDQARGVVSRELPGGFSIAAGAEWEGESASTSSAFGAGLDDATQRSRALFAQGSWAARALRFELGLRRDDHSSFGGATSLRAGAVVALGPRVRLRASYGESFRAPALGDLYYPGFGNPELEAERGASWEAGLEAGRGAWRGRLTGFRNDLEELIQFDPVRFLPFNIGRARTEGIEAGLELRTGRWRARGDVTWLDAEDRTSGEPLPRRPEWTSLLSVAWTGDRLGGGAHLRAVGEREDVGGVRLGSYAVLDLTASVELGRGFAPFARVENALDREFEEAAGYPAPRRSWVAGLSWRAGR